MDPASLQHGPRLLQAEGPGPVEEMGREAGQGDGAPGQGSVLLGREVK